jgi:hypothetical protein
MQSVVAVKVVLLCFLLISFACFFAGLAAPG